jgi:hypothetical protein
MTATSFVWFYVFVPIVLILWAILSGVFLWWAFTAPRKEFGAGWGLQLVTRCSACFVAALSILAITVSIEEWSSSPNRPHLSIEPVVKKEAKP